MGIAIIADAVSNLFRDIIEDKKLKVTIMNVRLRIDEKESFVYDDIKNVHLFSKTYFEAMKNPKVKIQTTLVSTGEYYEQFKKEMWFDFPGDPVVKNSPAKAGDMGSIPGPGRSHMPRGN